MYVLYIRDIHSHQGSIIILCEINSLAKTIILQIFRQKSVRVNFSNFHNVKSSQLSHYYFFL